MERTSREAWAKRIERWKDSGLTAEEFAAETGIKAHTLSWWKWRLGGSATKGATSVPRRRRTMKPADTATKPSPVTFVEMPSVVTSGASPMEVVLTSSTRIVVPPDFDATALGRLLDVLEARR